VIKKQVINEMDDQAVASDLENRVTYVCEGERAEYTAVVR